MLAKGPITAKRAMGVGEVEGLAGAFESTRRTCSAGCIDYDSTIIAAAVCAAA